MDILANARAQRHAARVIIMTAFGSEPTSVGQWAGAHGSSRKPFNLRYGHLCAFFLDALMLRCMLEFISICDMLCLQGKEATAMGTLRFADLQTRSTELLDLTSLTVEEFQQLDAAL